MDKLKMAHDYLLKIIPESPLVDESDICFFVDTVWKYADAMQAESEKREDKTRPEVLTEGWQPDWSQAPENMNYFFMNKDGSKYWTVNKPDKPNLSEHVMDCLECGGDCYAYASSQDYQGNWQDSLRKRPQ